VAATGDDGTRRSRSGSARPPECVQLVPREDTAVLVLLGEHDTASAKRLETQLMPLVAETPVVILDLSHVQFLDSSSIATLLGAHKHAASNGHRVVIELGQNLTARRLLEIAGLLDQLTCVTTRDEAFLVRE
jgi:anti-sigma B factor antagonist